MKLDLAVEMLNSKNTNRKESIISDINHYFRKKN